MRMRPVNDSDTLEFVCWLLGDTRVALTDYLKRAFSKRIDVEFDWLTQHGNIIFYDQLLSDLASDPLPSSLRKRLSGIQRLAPGDFKTVKTQFSFYPRKNGAM
jgi:hypothetical protein